MNKQTLFPDILYTGTLEISHDIHTKILDGIEKLKDSGASVDTHFGWISNPDVPLKGSLKSLQLLVGRTFVDNLQQTFGKVSAKKINCVQPYVSVIKPQHTFNIETNPKYFYTGCVWIQTSDKGNKLFFEDPGSKRFSSPYAFQKASHVEERMQYKYAFWPSHVFAGYTPNLSMINSIIINMGFTAT